MESQTLTTMTSEAMTAAGMDCLVTLVENVCALPAVATLDWCDRAAEAFAGVIPGATAVVMIANGNIDGTIRAIESVGAAKQNATHDGELGELRLRAERLKSLDVNLASVREGKALAGMISRGATNPVFELFGATAHAAAAGVSPLGDTDSGRILCVLISSSTEIPEWAPAVLRSILPSLSRKVMMAIGATTTAKSAWISPREQMVLEQLILGKSVKQIADDLGRSPHTVHDHVKALHRKLNASSRGELVARALGHMMEGTRVRGTDGAASGHGDGRQAA